MSYEVFAMTQTFLEYMIQFLQEKQPEIVIEVGSDVQLERAFCFAPYCKTMYSVTLPEDCVRMAGWHDLRCGMSGIQNVNLIGSDATQLLSLVSHADVIFLHNVILDGNNGYDTSLMWKYNRDELPCSETDWFALVKRFHSTEEKAYKGFLEVAKPGYIISFNRAELGAGLRKRFVQNVGIKPTQIETIPLFYETGDKELWEASVIHNL